MLAGITWFVGSIGSTVVESDEQVLVGVPDDGHIALYEVCFKQQYRIPAMSAFENFCNSVNQMKHIYVQDDHKCG